MIVFGRMREHRSSEPCSQAVAVHWTGLLVCATYVLIGARLTEEPAAERSRQRATVLEKVQVPSGFGVHRA